ncbi:hypothetical protein NM688_g9346 [Phlebia brevispora]|uniref:Uncharacterized protein n=1 Tax=Phlebia brevispora TaxID=194682 RepID=A0ACC1RIN3_9APHY|nr:hypothetical protein NM688_g9346 [Phlebia brevispora]
MSNEASAMYAPYRYRDFRHPCSQCDKTFESEKGLTLHRSQVHSNRPLKPIRWIQIDDDGNKTKHFADPQDDVDNPGHQVYYCPRDQYHITRSSRGFKRHLRSCHKEIASIVFKTTEGTPDLLYPDDSLPPTPDEPDDDRNDLTWPRRPPKRRGRPPTRGHWSLDHREGEQTFIAAV